MVKTCQITAVFQLSASHSAGYILGKPVFERERCSCRENLIFFAFMSEQVGVLLPCLAVELRDNNIVCLSVEAVDVDINAIRVGARNIKRFDTALFAKPVLRDMRVKCVGS